MLRTYGRLLALYTILLAARVGNVKALLPVYANQPSSGEEKAGSESMLRTNWFRHITATKSDGGSWLWGWAWGADNTVSVVDRSPPVSFVSRPASFGKIVEDAVNGYGIPMNAFTVLCNETEKGDRDTLEELGPNLGCPTLCPSGNHLPRAEESWIAIVQRGSCSFVAKVREAQRFGAKAVIVGGDDPAISGNPDVLVNMYSQTDASDVKIPSTYIKFSDYSRLSHLISTSNTSTSGLKTVSLQITADYASWEWYSPILTFIVLLLLPSALTLTTLLIHRIRATRAEQRERAPEDVVNRLPWRVWTGSGWEKHEGPVPPPNSKVTGEPNGDVDLERGDLDDILEAQQLPGQRGAGQCKPSTSHDEADGDVETRSVNPPWFDAQTECAICLSEFERGDRVRILPCKHIFHLEEVDEWLIHRKKLCPVCKADVTQPSRPYVHLHAELGSQPNSITNFDSISHPQSVPNTAADPNERTPLLQSQRTRSVSFVTPELHYDQPPTPYSYTRSPSPSPSPSTSSRTTSPSPSSHSTARPFSSESGS